MRHVRTSALFKVPNGLSPEWQKVFEDLAALLYTVRCYVYAPGLAQGSEQMLKNACLSMDRSKKQLKETLERLYGVAPKTFDVGCGIQNATLTIAGQFGTFRHWKK